MTREEAIDLAERLVAQKKYDAAQSFCERALEAFKSEPCEDAVSRKSIIEKAYHEAKAMKEPFRSQFGMLVEWIVDKTPSVTPAPREDAVPWEKLEQYADQEFVREAKAFCKSLTELANRQQVEDDERRN